MKSIGSNSLRFIFLIFIFPLSNAVNYFRFSIVITRSDLSPGTSIDCGFSNGNYRVFGTYCSKADNADFTRNIHVTGNSTVSLTTLSQTTQTSPYLTGTVMKAPIKISNTNPPSSTEYPFTIYITHEIRELPVVDARSANGIQRTDVTIAYGGITILSAEPFYNLHSFQLHALPFTSILFSSCGYDPRLNEYQIMKIPSYDFASSSLLSISSPIVTLYTQTDGIFSSFNYTIDKENISISSPGWLNSTDSFPYEFPIAPFLNHSFTFIKKRLLSVSVSVSDFLPNEKVVIQAGTQDDNTFESWSLISSQKTSYQIFGSTVRVSVTTASITHTPRFLVQITSGSSQLLTPLWICAFILLTMHI